MTSLTLLGLSAAFICIKLNNEHKQGILGWGLRLPDDTSLSCLLDYHTSLFMQYM
jgi:hypothetical protein